RSGEAASPLAGAGPGGAGWLREAMAERPGGFRRDRIADRSRVDRGGASRGRARGGNQRQRGDAAGGAQGQVRRPARRLGGGHPADDRAARPPALGRPGGPGAHPPVVPPAGRPLIRRAGQSLSSSAIRISSKRAGPSSATSRTSGSSSSEAASLPINA